MKIMVLIGEKMLKLSEFKEGVKNNTITNYEEYLYSVDTWEHREYMAVKGICVNELVKLNEPGIIQRLITSGHGTEYYEEWKTHPYWEIRKEIAEKGYYPDEFIKDKNDKVRMAVFDANPSYDNLEILIQDVRLHEFIMPRLYYWVDINEPMIRLMLQYVDIEDSEKESVKAKLQALKQPVTAITSTMTTEQLYLVNNPLWARNLTIGHIHTIQCAYNTAKRHDRLDKFYKHLHTLLLPDYQHLAYWDIVHER